MSKVTWLGHCSKCSIKDYGAIECRKCEKLFCEAHIKTDIHNCERNDAKFKEYHLAWMKYRPGCVSYVGSEEWVKKPSGVL